MRSAFSIVPAGVSLALAAALISGCSSSKKLDPFAGVGSPVYKKAGPIPKGGGRRHVGKPYQVAGRWFHPKEDPSYDKQGVASWYGPKFHKRMTANGEWFDMNYQTAAHATLPLPSYAKVTNLETGKAIIVRVNDRGPFVGDRIIDMSRRSATLLGFKRQGKAKVRVQYIGPAPVNDKGPHLAAMIREHERGTPLKQMIAAVDGKRPASPDGIRVAGKPGHKYNVAGNGSLQGGYFVQVAAFSDETNALRTRERLSGLGQVIVTPVNASFGTVYRVQLGPLQSQDAARNTLRQVVEAGHGDARVIARH